MTLANKRWVEIAVEAEREAVDDLLGLLNKHCPGGAAMEDLREGPRFPTPDRVLVKGYLPEGDDATLQKLEIALLLLSRSAPISEPRVRLLQPEDWTEAWKAFFPPLPIGQHLVVVPTWVEYEVQPGQVPLYLDPGMAFGTGLHATTRLCLIALERLLTPGMAVLDVGAGSGILSIAAALLGAGQIDAMDIDPIAVEVAQENAALNHVADRISVSHATLAGRSTARAPIYQGEPRDLLLINILAEIIIDLAASLPPHLKPGGICIASGIIAEKAEDVRQALEAVGLAVVEQLDEGGWVALVARQGA
jgi:ribosomal protein L11 methyltransferase